MSQTYFLLLILESYLGCIYTYIPHHPLFNSAAISSSIVHRYQLHYQFFTTRRRRLCANTTGEIEPNNSRWCIFTHCGRGLSIISVGNFPTHPPAYPLKGSEFLSIVETPASLSVGTGRCLLLDVHRTEPNRNGTDIVC